MNKVLVEILGLSTSPASNGYALILQEKSGHRRLPIMIEAAQAQAIALEMEGIKSQRPMSHDLMKSIVETMGSRLVEIIINDIQDSTFYAQLILESAGTEVDARPSDAIALAVRFNAPIYVAVEVMDEAAFEAESSDYEGEGDEMADESLATTVEERTTEKSSMSRREVLAQELQKAIDKEDYETAAIIRDEISKLDNDSDGDAS